MMLGQWCGAVPFGVVAVDVVVVWAAWDRASPAAANATPPPAAAVQTAASARMRVSFPIPLLPTLRTWKRSKLRGG